MQLKLSVITRITHTERKRYVQNKKYLFGMYKFTYLLKFEYFYLNRTMSFVRGKI